MLRAYCRCNSGHYYVGEYCPLDGWASSESKELAAAVNRLSCAGLEVSIVALRDMGLSDATLKRAIVVEFGSETSAFDAISPEGYVINGKWKRLRDLGEEFT